MPDGIPTTYRLSEEQTIRGVLVPAGTHPGWSTAHRSANHPGGIQTKHWVQIPDQRYEIEITELVEKGLADVV